MAAARQAVLALRADAVPLPDQLSSLADEYRAVGDQAVDFTITGEVRPVSGEASLAAYRMAQEALTNVRKHSPGQPVTLRLGFEPGQITVDVVNPLPPRRVQGLLADIGAGYGLTGLRERAAGRSNPGDRSCAVRQRGDGQDAHQPDLRQDGLADRMQAMRYAYTHGFADPASQAAPRPDAPR